MYRSIGKEISIISRQFNKYIARELKPLNISVSEYIFIINVQNGTKINQQQLCDEFVIDKAQATRAISSLVEKGILIREKSTEDKREYLISLTKEGEIIKPQIAEKLRNWSKILKGTMSDKKQEEIVNILEMFRKNAMEENNLRGTCNEAKK